MLAYVVRILITYYVNTYNFMFSTWIGGQLPDNWTNKEIWDQIMARRQTEKFQIKSAAGKKNKEKVKAKSTSGSVPFPKRLKKMVRI